MRRATPGSTTRKGASSSRRSRTRSRARPGRRSRSSPSELTGFRVASPVRALNCALWNGRNTEPSQFLVLLLLLQQPVEEVPALLLERVARDLLEELLADPDLRALPRPAQLDRDHRVRIEKSSRAVELPVDALAEHGQRQLRVELDRLVDEAVRALEDAVLAADPDRKAVVPRDALLDRDAQLGELHGRRLALAEHARESGEQLVGDFAEVQAHVRVELRQVCVERHRQ